MAQVVDRHRGKRARDPLARGEQHVHLARLRPRRYLVRHRDQLVGGLAASGQHGHHAAALLLGPDDPGRGRTDALDIGYGRAAELHDDRLLACGSGVVHGRPRIAFASWAETSFERCAPLAASRRRCCSRWCWPAGRPAAPAAGASTRRAPPARPPRTRGQRPGSARSWGGSSRPRPASCPARTYPSRSADWWPAYRWSARSRSSCWSASTGRTPARRSSRRCAGWTSAAWSSGARTTSQGPSSRHSPPRWPTPPPVARTSRRSSWRSRRAASSQPSPTSRPASRRASWPAPRTPPRRPARRPAPSSAWD